MVKFSCFRKFEFWPKSSNLDKSFTPSRNRKFLDIWQILFCSRFRDRWQQKLLSFRDNGYRKRVRVLRPQCRRPGNPNAVNIGQILWQLGMTQSGVILCFAIVCAFVEHRVLRIFLWQSFDDLSQFWWFWDFGMDFKILKKSCDGLFAQYWDQFWKNLTFEFWSKSQSYDKPPWRNFDFWSIFWILAKIENLKSLTLAQIQILDP